MSQKSIFFNSDGDNLLSSLHSPKSRLLKTRKAGAKMHEIHTMQNKIDVE